MKVELICFLYDKKMIEDLGIKTEDIEANITIDTKEIESVRERAEDTMNEICKKTCMVHMKSGDSYVIGTSYKQMLKLWD